MLSTQRMRNGIQQCASCDDSIVDRVEHLIRPMLLPKVDHPPSALDDVMFGTTCDVTKRRRPDFLWIGEDRVIQLEVDERGGHSDRNYTPECDLGFIMDINHCINHLFASHGYNDGKVPHHVVLRMNPDECDRMYISLEDRVDQIAERINHYLKVPLDPTSCPVLEYHYYHTKCSRHISYARTNPDSVHVVCEV